jgi:plastocyanin
MTRRGTHRNHIGAATLAAAMLIGFITGCFSDRVTSTEAPPASGECRIPTSSTAAGSVVIFVRDFTFIPQQVTVKRGTRVTWVNCESPTADAHTSTSDAGVWDSPRFAPAEIYSRTFNDAGSVFNYHCVPHPFMQGTITVE